MPPTDPPGKIFAAIPAIIADVDTVGKNTKNKEQGFSYRSADAICEELHDALGKHKVFTTCEIINREVTERESNRGGTLFCVSMKTKYTFHAEDGSSIVTESWGDAMDSGDKATNKAMTAAYKYALLQVFCLMGHGDPDENSPEPASQTETKRAPKPACPKCGKTEFVLANRPPDNPGWFCWKNEEKKKLGCGHRWSDPPNDAANVPGYTEVSPGIHAPNDSATAVANLSADDMKFVEEANQSFLAIKSDVEARKLWKAISDSKSPQVKTLIHPTYSKVLHSLAGSA